MHLVSIIIPTYNRSYLIGETLDSIANQTYTNWECIIVDDGSTDSTSELMEVYCKKDPRFKYYHRPKTKPKGANACRNYGFELSKGEYVNWFDDDDIMLSHFIENKVRYLHEFDVDFVFSNTYNFFANGDESPMFNNHNYKKEINATNFILQSIVWCTLDFMSRKKVLLDVKFNEKLKSGQEYNFFCKYLLQKVTGVFLDEVLSKRRIHEVSIQQEQTKNFSLYTLNKYMVYLTTLIEVKHKSSENAIHYLVGLSMSRAYDLMKLRKNIPFFFELINIVYREKKMIKFFGFILSLIIGFIFRKGYFLLKYSKKIK